MNKQILFTALAVVAALAVANNWSPTRNLLAGNVSPAADFFNNRGNR